MEGGPGTDTGADVGADPPEHATRRPRLASTQSRFAFPRNDDIRKDSDLVGRSWSHTVHYGTDGKFIPDMAVRRSTRPVVPGRRFRGRTGWILTDQPQPSRARPQAPR